MEKEGDRNETGKMLEKCKHANKLGDKTQTKTKTIKK